MSHTMPRIIVMLLVATSLPFAGHDVAAQEVGSTPTAYGPYKVEIKISELERAKTVDTRSYTMVMAKGVEHNNAYGRVRVGNRVPYASKTGEYQYQDVGMNIDCSLHPRDSDHVVTELTVNSTGTATGPGSSVAGNPVFRNLQWQGSPVVALGKPTVVSEVDDVTSDHRYQIEMTVTAIK